MTVVPPLVSVRQVARRLGMSHQMASKMTRRRRDLFPTVVEVGDAAAGDRVVRLFLASELEAAAAVVRRPGRPWRVVTGEEARTGTVTENPTTVKVTPK